MGSSVLYRNTSDNRRTTRHGRNNYLADISDPVKVSSVAPRKAMSSTHRAVCRAQIHRGILWLGCGKLRSDIAHIAITRKIIIVGFHDAVVGIDNMDSGGVVIVRIGCRRQRPCLLGSGSRQRARWDIILPPLKFLWVSINTRHNHSARSTDPIDPNRPMRRCRKVG